MHNDKKEAKELYYVVLKRRVWSWKGPVVETRECGPGKGPLWRRESVALKRACCGDREEEYSCCCWWWWWWWCCCLSPSVREQGLLPWREECGPEKGLLWRREIVALKMACCGEQEEEYSCCCFRLWTRLVAGVVASFYFYRSLFVRALAFVCPLLVLRPLLSYPALTNNFFPFFHTIFAYSMYLKL